jgi:hypothetical protein
MAIKKEPEKIKKLYQNILDHQINVNGLPHDPKIPFEETETQELINLVNGKYLEEV